MNYILTPSLTDNGSLRFKLNNDAISKHDIIKKLRESSIAKINGELITRHNNIFERQCGIRYNIKLNDQLSGIIEVQSQKLKERQAEKLLGNANGNPR